jgi:cyclopropane-fatty-acyl-phospholipid synthase
MDVATFVASVFNNQLPFRVEAYDGSVAAPTIVSSANDVTLKLLSRDALTRVLTHPGELGLARAYVAGDIDIDGELDSLFELSVPPVRQLLKADNLRSLLSVVGLDALRPIAPPPIEASSTAAHATARQSHTTTTCRTLSTRWSSAPR